MKYFTRLASFIPLLALVKAEFIYSCTEKKTIALTVYIKLTFFFFFTINNNAH